MTHRHTPDLAEVPQGVTDLVLVLVMFFATVGVMAVAGTAGWLLVDWLAV